MALDQAYFDAIKIEVVKRKYYNANKVEAVLEDIRREALALTEENARLRERVSQFYAGRAEIGDALLSAKSVAQQILQDAQTQAETIVAEAEERRREMLAASEQEEIVRRTEACYSRVREQLLACVESLNAEWQDYLCSLSDDEFAAPEDLDEKVGAIAREVFAIGEEDKIEAEEIKA